MKLNIIPTFLCERIVETLYKHELWCTFFTGESSMNTTLHGSGKAILDVKNCNNNGIVAAYKNDVEIISLNAENNDQIEFEFEDGDVIKISELNGGIIELNSLAVVGCSTFETQVFKKNEYILGNSKVFHWNISSSMNFLVQKSRIGL